MIIKLTDSPLPFKRYRVFMDNGDKPRSTLKHFDFGLKDGTTYIDHKDKILRENYLKRHLANTTEKHLIQNLIPSPALFSALLLWGKHTDIKKNVIELNKLWKIKHNRS
jgi:hypothetical protein